MAPSVVQTIPVSRRLLPSLLSLRRLTLVVAFAALLSVLFTLAAHAQNESAVLSPEARAIASKLACPVCEGESIVESNSDVSANMRRKVQEMVDQGYTEQQILDHFVEAFGVSVLREPPKEGVALGVWIVPPMVMAAGAGIVFLVLRKWRRQGSRLPTPDEMLPDNEAESRVESDLRRWEGRG